MGSSRLKRLLGRAAALAGLALVLASTGVGFRHTYHRRPKPRPVLDVRVETDVPGTAISSTVRVCRNKSTLFAVWSDARNGELDIYFNRSRDGGRTWLARDVRVESDAPGAARSLDPEIRCVGNRLYVVWEDDRDGYRDIRCTTSYDGGRRFLANDVRVDTDPRGNSDSVFPRVLRGHGETQFFWVDYRNGQGDIYTKKLGQKKPKKKWHRPKRRRYRP